MQGVPSQVRTLLVLSTELQVLVYYTRYSREEPFTALNVDIRNKQHLYESLDAFVKGDLLEGANAYHCEKCDKKVCVQVFYLWSLMDGLCFPG